MRGRMRGRMRSQRRRGTRAGAVGLALAWLGGGLPAAAEPLEFAVLSYNVAGLPPGISYADPRPRLPRIGERLGRYEVALLQETFSHFEALTDGLEAPVLERGPGPRDDWLGFLLLERICGRCGSGLATAALRDARPVRIERRAYSGCAGWLLPWTGADCGASKGWLLTRVRLARRVVIDFWNTHLDAGGRRADARMRAQQLAELADAMERHSEGRPVILGGDFNLSVERVPDAAELRRLRERLRLADSGALRVDRERFPRAIDHIYYRGARGLALEVTEAGQAHEFEVEGRPLSDHPAVFARFRARLLD